MSLLANVLLYQAGWLACIAAASQGMPWIAAASAVPVVAWHLARAARPRRELCLIAFVAATGAAFETALALSGWVRFPGAFVEGLAPLWIVALWATFATTLNVSLRGLRERPALTALLAAAGAPAAYYAGARMGAMEFATIGTALAAIAAGWALLTPLLLCAARRFDGYARP